MLELNFKLVLISFFCRGLGQQIIGTGIDNTPTWKGLCSCYYLITKLMIKFRNRLEITCTMTIFLEQLRIIIVYSTLI